jgi:predicted O-linked N-acetylglucosamine transferase (SPINDLY family)
MRERWLAEFAAHGIAADRIELRGASPHAQMLREYADMDIALDCFPFSGGLTSCEALWMGVPIITLSGQAPQSRQTAGFLRQLGREEWIATTPDAYVAAATQLARDIGALDIWRGSLRLLMAQSPLCDAEAFARRFEQAMRESLKTGP